MKSHSPKFLFSCPTTIIIYTSIRNRHPAWLYDNLNNILALHDKMICFRKNTCIIDNLVGYILQLFMEIVNANNSQIVINANIYLSPLGVSEAGYPLQVFVFPYTFMLNVLILLIHIAKLPQNTDIHKLINNFEA